MTRKIGTDFVRKMESERWDLSFEQEVTERTEREKRGITMHRDQPLEFSRGPFSRQIRVFTSHTCVPCNPWLKLPLIFLSTIFLPLNPVLVSVVKGPLRTHFKAEWKAAGAGIGAAECGRPRWNGWSPTRCRC